MSKTGWVTALCLLAGGMGSVGCGSAPARVGPPLVVTTTGMIADLAARVGGPHVRVEALMQSGIDPHLFKPSESDVRRLSEARLILYNGLHLEGKMGDVLEKMARSRPVVAVAEAAIPPDRRREAPGFGGQYDPHVWFDVSLWTLTLEPITEQLEALVPEQAETFRRNAEAVRAELTALDAWVASQVLELTPDQRVLVTAHDAFGYFGRRYGVEVVGLQGISTVSEAGLQDVDRLVGRIVSGRLKAIFVESSVPRRSIEAVQAAVRSRGHEVAIGGQLFSDAMGASGTPEGTYPGMVRHNVTTFVEAMR